MALSAMQARVLVLILLLEAAAAAAEFSTCVTHAGLNRCWLTLVPTSVSPGTSVPLVVEMHGYGSRNTQLSYTQWQNKAEVNAFVLVRPMGTEGPGDQKPSWNAGWCCGGSADGKANVDDVGFIRKVVQQTVAATGAFVIDQARVYMAGHSNGCALAQRMAVEASDIVAAVGCHSMYLVTKRTPAATKSAVPSDYTAVPVMTVHGTADTTVKYSGWMGGHGLENNLQLWKEINGCAAATPAATSGTGYGIKTYTGCGGGGAVAAVTLPDVGHVPFKGKGTDVDTTQLAWDFVSQYRKKKTAPGPGTTDAGSRAPTVPSTTASNSTTSSGSEQVVSGGAAAPTAPTGNTSVAGTTHGDSATTAPAPGAPDAGEGAVANKTTATEAPGAGAEGEAKAAKTTPATEAPGAGASTGMVARVWHAPVLLCLVAAAAW